MSLVGGPEEYLFGEEKALLEVIEGNDPMPRWLPPYLHGLYATTPQEGWSAGSRPLDSDDAARVGSNPTLVTSVDVGEEEQRVIATLLRAFPDDFAAALEGALVEPLAVPKIIDIRDGVAVYDEKQMRKQPDWTYAPLSS